MLKHKCAGQSIAEYAVVLGIVIAAVVAMQIYVRRQLQGRIKGAVDYVPTDATKLFTTGQYEPTYAKSDIDTTRKGEILTTTEKYGKVTRDIQGKEVSTREGTQETEKYN